MCQYNYECVLSRMYTGV